jgi:hypothetical protein
MSIKRMLHPSASADIRVQQPTIENNVAGFIGWDRLQEALRDSGELTPKEEVEAFVITDTGIQFYVKRR